MLKLVYSKITRYFYPPRCFSCLDLVLDPYQLCSSCFKKIDFIDNFCCTKCGRIAFSQDFECAQCLANMNVFTSARSLFTFNDYSKKIIHTMKYNDNLGVGKVLAKLLVNRYPDIVEKVDLVIPVPMHHLKRLLRQYNPANNIGKYICLFTKKEFAPTFLKKIKLTKPQIGLSRQQRKKNLAGSIKIGFSKAVLGKSVLLVDDVITTGSTVNLCSKILFENGAKNVFVFTIASL